LARRRGGVVVSQLAKAEERVPQSLGLRRVPVPKFVPFGVRLRDPFATDGLTLHNPNGLGERIPSCLLDDAHACHTPNSARRNVSTTRWRILLTVFRWTSSSRAIPALVTPTPFPSSVRVQYFSSTSRFSDGVRVRYTTSMIWRRRWISARLIARSSAGRVIRKDLPTGSSRMSVGRSPYSVSRNRRHSGTA